MQVLEPGLVYDRAHMLSNLRLMRGMRVAEFYPSGNHNFVFESARAVGEFGDVFAIHILKDALDAISHHAKDTGLHHIHTVWSDCETVGATAVPEKTLDAIIITHLLSRSTKPINILTEAGRLLKNKARILITDWKDRIFPLPADRTVIPESVMRHWATQNGFAVEKIFYPSSKHQSIVLFRSI